MSGAPLKWLPQQDLLTMRWQQLPPGGIGPFILTFTDEDDIEYIATFTDDDDVEYISTGAIY